MEEFRRNVKLFLWKRGEMRLISQYRRGNIKAEIKGTRNVSFDTRGAECFVLKIYEHPPIPRNKY